MAARSALDSYCAFCARGLESLREEGFGVEVLFFQVGVENHGEIADEDAA